jgi:hypothetical protein
LVLIIRISDLLIPHLKWLPGKKAQAVRTAASSCLWSLLSSKCIARDQLLQISPALVPAMNGLVEDGADHVRSFICRAIRNHITLGIYIAFKLFANNINIHSLMRLLKNLSKN